MFSNYLKIALRSLLRQKSYSAINITGLAVGIAACLLIVLYVAEEMSVDAFHTNGNSIYRLMRKSEIDGSGSGLASPWTAAQYTPLLQASYANEVQDIVRVLPTDGLVRYGERAFKEPHIVFADANFFRVFSFPLIQGDPASVLKNPNSIVISEAAAKKYFGNGSAIGKVLQIDNEYELLVTGVFTNPPNSSHLEFEMVASISLFAQSPWFKEIIGNNLYTYLKLRDNISSAQLEAKFPEFVRQNLNEALRRGIHQTLQLQALREIYFYDAPPFVCVRHGEKNTIYLLSMIAGIVLIIACVNFMNLATARSMNRAKEVGMRKVMGAYRRNLITQFLGESFLITSVSVVLAVALVESVLPMFNAFTERTLVFPLTNPFVVIGIIALIFVIGTFAGIYPAFFLSSFQPVTTLKGSFKTHRSSASLRSGLVVVQFVISTVLIIGTLVMQQQMRYMNTKKLGFDKEHIVLVRIDNQDIYTNQERFRTALLQSPFIKSVSAMSGQPGGFHDSFPFTVQGKEQQYSRLRTVFTDEHYAKTLGLTVNAGRDFSLAFPNDKTGSVLLNQAAVRHLGWQPQEAIGKVLRMNMRDTVAKTVIGLVEDFHFASLKEQIDPLIITIGSDHRVFAVKLRAGENMAASLAAVEGAYHHASPKFPFEYSFLDESFGKLYRTEQKQQTLMSLFSSMAIIISCMGLFGLAAYSAEVRTKEIGIRKVLGASVASIIGLLSKDFLKLVGIAIVVAAPLAYWAAGKWLQDFAYRVDVSWWVFAAAGVLAVGIAFLTVASQSWRAAAVNPIQSLKSE